MSAGNNALTLIVFGSLLFTHTTHTHNSHTHNSHTHTLHIQWWSTDGECQKKLFLKSTFGKYVRFSPDFKTFVTIDNSGLLYVLTALKTPST